VTGGINCPPIFSILVSLADRLRAALLLNDRHSFGFILVAVLDRTMIDENLARRLAHRQNIDRYRRLLDTNLSALERDFIERRITEEEAALHRFASNTFALTLRDTSASEAA
jgi:hypothetical protein